MDKVKTVAMVGGIILIWTGGLLLAWKGGGFVGKQVGKICLAGSEKLIKVLS